MEKIFEIVRIKQEIRESDHTYAKYKITNPQAVVDIAIHEIAEDDREVFFVLCLNTKNEVVGFHRSHVGQLDASIVNVREVYKSAILNNARSIICFHQHPSGNVQPSDQDHQVTERLEEAGKILDIELLDHIIVSYTGDYYSFKANGML
jgi:DNA repair protein RadC